MGRLWPEWVESGHESYRYSSSGIAWAIECAGRFEGEQRPWSVLLKGACWNWLVESEVGEVRRGYA